MPRCFLFELPHVIHECLELRTSYLAGNTFARKDEQVQ
jgi:hypothetical protein